MTPKFIAENSAGLVAPWAEEDKSDCFIEIVLNEANNEVLLVAEQHSNDEYVTLFDSLFDLYHQSPSGCIVGSVYSERIITEILSGVKDSERTFLRKRLVELDAAKALLDKYAKS